MTIKINGKDESVDNAATIEGLISGKKLSPERIVVEHNYRIVPKEEWQDTTLKSNDNIEIVSFVGGG